MTRTERIRELMEDEGMSRAAAVADMAAYGIPLTVACAWCTPGVDAPGMSHGICERHAAELAPECPACGAPGTDCRCAALDEASRRDAFADSDVRCFELAHAVRL